MVELSACMQLGHDDLGRADAFSGMHVDRDAAPVVAHADAAVGMDLDLHEVGMAGQDLVDAVVHDLIDHVVQAGPVVGIADIHAGTLSHGVQTLENLDGIGVVQSGLGGGVGHASGFLFVMS